MAASIITNPPEKGGLSFRKQLDSVPAWDAYSSLFNRKAAFVDLELVEPTRHGEGLGAEL